MKWLHARLPAQWMDSPPGKQVSWAVDKARSVALYLAQLCFLVLLASGAAVSWLLGGGDRRDDADGGVQADTTDTQKRVESTKTAKASAASDDVSTPRMRLLGVCDSSNGPSGTTAEIRSGTTVAGEWPVDSLTQERPVRPQPTSSVYQRAATSLSRAASPPPLAAPATAAPALDAAEVLLLGLGLDAVVAAECGGELQRRQPQATLVPDVSPASPPATHAANTLGPTPSTPPPPHPRPAASAARTEDPATEEEEAAAAAADAERVAHGCDSAAGMHVARNLETALLTAADETAGVDADTADADTADAGADATNAASSVQEVAGTHGSGELTPAPHQPGKLRGEGQQQSEDRAEQRAGSGSEAHGAEADMAVAVPHADKQSAAVAQQPGAPAAAAGSGGGAAAKRQSSAGSRAVGGNAGKAPGAAAHGSRDAPQAGPAAATATASAAPKGSKDALLRQQSGPKRAGGSAGGAALSAAKAAPAGAAGAVVTPIKRTSSGGSRHTATTVTTTAAASHQASSNHKEEQASPAHAGELPAAAAVSVTQGTGAAPQAPADASTATRNVPHYLLPTAASMSRRTSQGLGSPPADGGSHSAATGALPVKGRSIQLPAAHHEEGAPVSPGSGAAAALGGGLRSLGTAGRTASLRRVSHPTGTAPQAPGRSVSSTGGTAPSVGSALGGGTSAGGLGGDGAQAVEGIGAVAQ
ncbi:hypothetical protein HXX76_015762 [Chlamydomonas incerta]|uniref:Uncharacterized protein n=1 Tax=Chlamydomonas incerta TaxID=51695 RepID=A0A835VR63_CHLIN|nr:hypothetical protein HXX76_015762 [Chlamydomonas incerta]|eukprot:KAG2422818.1 hypothetical protein HXX76_015762 [Chlamydomonas incerta]